jgi:hypothetical protein
MDFLMRNRDIIYSSILGIESFVGRILHEIEFNIVTTRV